MNLTDLKDRLTTELAMEPQRQALATGAVDSVVAGIAELAKLGYRFTLVPSEHPAVEAQVEEYPKMLYRNQVPTELTVDSEEAETEARADGYRALNEAVKPVPEPAVDSQPKNSSTEAPVQAPKPAMTEKEVVEARMAAGSGASKPNVPGAGS